MTPMTLITGLGTFPIPAGNWDADSFSAYMNSVGVTNVFDYATFRYTFSPSVTILSGTTCQRLLGLPEGWTGEVTTSTQPVNFVSVSVVNVDTTLSLYNAPISGRLASIPINANYGDQVQYFDSSGSLPVLMMNHQLSTLEITLTDQDGQEITCFEEIPWTLTIELQEVSGLQYDTLFERL